jgi:Acetyltransferase (GNAT) domain
MRSPLPGQGLKIRIAEESDDSYILKLMRREYGEARVSQADFYRWQYRLNPFGSATIGCCESSVGEIVAALPTIPVPVLLDGRPARAALILNVITDKEYRRKGLFVKCAKVAFEELAGAGTVFAFGFPNAIIYPGYVNKLNCIDIGRGRLMMRLHDLHAIVAMKLPVARYVPLKSLFRVFERVLQRNPRQSVDVKQIHSFDGVAVDRLRESSRVVLNGDSTWMNWRYKQVPGQDHKILAAGGGGQPDGIAVYRFDDRFGLKIGVLMELMVSPDAGEEAVQSLMNQVFARCREGGCAATFCLAALGTRKMKMLRQSGFLLLSDKLEPHPYPIIHRKLAEGATDLGVGEMDVSYGLSDY